MTAPARPRARRWPWLVALVAVAALAVGAWFAGEYIARGIVERTVRDQVQKQLALPADQQIDVDIPGQILPQLISGTLDEITLSSRDVPLGQLTGDVVVRASGVPIRGDGPATDASASVTLTEPDIGVAMELRLFALTVPVGVGLTPSATAGQLVLTPTTFTVAGAQISAQALLDQFGAVGSTVIRDWDVCVAQYLPAGMTLSGVRVEGDHVVADVAIDGGIIHDPALQQKGTCA